MSLRVYLRIFLLIVLPIGASAQQAEPVATVWTSGINRSARALFAPGTEVRVLDRAEEERANRESGYLPPRERDAVFRKVGIETRIAKFDELEKDTLILAAREYSVRELKNEFPMLTVTQITKLKSELRRRK